MTDDELKIKFFDNLLCAFQLSSETIKAWGETTQLDKVVEECAELIVALQHSKTRTLDTRTVASEIADVLVMSMCAARVIGVDAVVDEMGKKLIRLKGRLETTRPKADAELQEKYVQAKELATEMESRYRKELAKTEELRRMLTEVKGISIDVPEENEKSVNKLSNSEKIGPKKKIARKSR
jgi:NTP pyrophosphatase (non-canonical NTP hydrolase)